MAALFDIVKLYLSVLKEPLVEYITITFYVGDEGVSYFLLNGSDVGGSSDEEGPPTRET